MRLYGHHAPRQSQWPGQSLLISDDLRTARCGKPQWLPA
jgi:hypothetical protein